MGRKKKDNTRILKALEYGIFFLLGFLAAFLVISTPTLQGASIVNVDIKEMPILSEASANIVAVSSADNSGVLGKVNVEVTEGDGRILVNTNPFLEPDIQFSVNVAAEVAKRISIQRLENRNLIYTFDVGEANVLGGHSAGAAMTIATVSALLNKELRDDVVITGTIRNDGVIGNVGGLIEKAQAAAENDKKIFLIPKGQSELVYYEKETRSYKKGQATITRTGFIPKTFNLTEYGRDELGIEVIEVETIYDVMDIMLK